MCLLQQSCVACACELSCPNRHTAGSWDSPTKDHQLVFIECGAVAPSVESPGTKALNTILECRQGSLAWKDGLHADARWLDRKGKYVLCMHCYKVAGHVPSAATKT